MKKIILLFLSAFLLSGCNGAVDRSGWQTYQNTYYNFELLYPQGYSYCLNAYCINEIPEDALATLFLADEEDNLVVTIQPYKNDLGMTAMAFGEKAAEYNSGISEAESISFAGQEAFAFTADTSFFEPGGARGISKDGHMSLTYDADATEAPYIELSERSRVIYVDYEGYFYRIIYTKTETAEAIAESFAFLD